jgi:hypothetical protein
MATGDKGKKIFVLALIICAAAISFSIDLQSFLKAYLSQSAVEDRVIVVFSSHPRVYTDVVKRKGEQLLVQTKTIEKEELILFKNFKSFLLIPDKKMYVPINVIDPELLVINLIKNKKNEIKKVYDNCYEIKGKDRYIRLYIENNHFSKIEMYLNGFPYKTITYTYYKEISLKDSYFEIPKDYKLPENNADIFDKLNNYYEKWCIKLFSPLVIEGFHDKKAGLVIISKIPISSSFMDELKNKIPGSKPSLKIWKNYYIISIGKSPF